MILSADNITFKYDNKQILNNVSFKADSGITSIIGPNAAGKTTLLKCLCGLLKINEGIISVNNKQLNNKKYNPLIKDVGYMQQHSNCYASLTVFEVVLLGKVQCLSLIINKKIKEKVLNILNELSIYHLKDKYITELSGGQKQLVFIAQSIVKNPHILLLDEPNNNLDLYNQFEIMDKVSELSIYKKLTIVITIHDINLAARFSDNIYVLKNGSVICNGSPNEIFNEKMIMDVYGVIPYITYDSDNKMLIIPQSKIKGEKNEPKNRIL